MVRVDGKGRHCANCPFAVVTAVTTWIALVRRTSKPIVQELMTGRRNSDE
jgi:hypothetical protein